MLAVHNLSVDYGPARALHGVTIAVPRGGRVALIGANGAGKSTLVNAICGIVPIAEGTVEFDGQAIAGRAPERIVRLGIAQVAEGRQLFPGLSVAENLAMGAYTVGKAQDVKRSLAEVYAMFPVLGERRHAPAQLLSGGEQQMLAIGRALMSRPKMMVFDEPSLGLAPLYVERIFSVLDDLNRQGIPILLIEQNVRLSLTVTDYAYVLERGRIVLEGTSNNLLSNPHVEASYLGI
ncbi:MAG: ABC transporter ATP-binding protein [Rhodospirillales bacterium]|nr:ABC transporter ATP-binding protein [Rhodospirillales bacterium]